MEETNHSCPFVHDVQQHNGIVTIVYRTKRAIKIALETEVS